MPLINQHDFFTRASEGAERRANELFEALRGAPAQAIRKFLDDAGLSFKETRLHSGPAGSTLWAVESAPALELPAPSSTSRRRPSSSPGSLPSS
ncbi:hypothetical protein [Rhizobium leguminosarum]|uniref:hypothetical protein n=1 Tax=Rhizobium leguminosarum TaxID=384 RepID=UPI002E104275|nr:hypothetical protein U8Q02_42040 [Rhizobium leguminosarum]